VQESEGTPGGREGVKTRRGRKAGRNGEKVSEKTKMNATLGGKEIVVYRSVRRGKDRKSKTTTKKGGITGGQSHTE